MTSIAHDAFLSFKFLGGLQASPSKTHAAFTRSQAHYEDNTYHHTLYVSDGHTNTRLKKLGKNQSFAFLDDTRLLVDYQKNKQERKNVSESHKQSFYIYNLSSRGLTHAFTLPIRGTIEGVIDANTVLFSAGLTPDDHVLYEGDEEARKAYLKEKKRTQYVEAIDELPYYFNAKGFKTNQFRQLFLYDIETGTLSRVFDKHFSVGSNVLSDDKRTLYYTGKHNEKIMTFTDQLYAFDLESKTHTTLYDGETYSIDMIQPVAGSLVVAAKDMKDYGLNQNPDFYTVEAGDLKLLRQYGESLGNTIGTDARLGASIKPFVKDDALYFVSTIGVNSALRTLTLDGEIKDVFTMPGSIDGIVDLGEHALLIGLKDQKLQELYSLDYQTGKLTAKSRFNARTLADSYVAKPIPTSLDKSTHSVDGFVLLPQDYDASKSYPAVLDIHGGPKTVYGSVFYHEMQYWANKGYVVMFANPRGSDGKGNAFADIRGKYGTIDYEDLMDFTDEVLNRYRGIDRNRLYVTGGSYGGFMTNWMVGHTQRFKAAVTQRSISNWISFYGTSDIGYFFAADQTDGHPIEDREKLYNQSPLKYSRNVRTPLLFVHSDKDYRCPMEQAQQFYAILKNQGLDTELVWIKDETHELSRSGSPQARITRINAITEWFDTH